MIEWAVFHGGALEQEDRYELSASGNGGVISVPKDCVSLAHGKISVKVGSIATIVKQPPELAGLMGFDQHHGCSSTFSVGLVEICADDGRVLGSARGSRIQ